MVIRRHERPNPLLKHLETYRRSSKSQLKLGREEIEHLARQQAESLLNHPGMRKKIKEAKRQTTDNTSWPLLMR